MMTRRKRKCLLSLFVVLHAGFQVENELYDGESNGKQNQNVTVKV